jgi:hypothetical protein
VSGYRGGELDRAQELGAVREKNRHPHDRRAGGCQQSRMLSKSEALLRRRLLERFPSRLTMRLDEL